MPRPHEKARANPHVLRFISEESHRGFRNRGTALLQLQFCIFLPAAAGLIDHARFAANDLLQKDFEALRFTRPESWPASFRHHHRAIPLLSHRPARQQQWPPVARVFCAGKPA